MKTKATTSQPLGWLPSKASSASPRRIYEVAEVEQKQQAFCNLPYKELVQLCRAQQLLSQAWGGGSTPCHRSLQGGGTTREAWGGKDTPSGHDHPTEDGQHGGHLQGQDLHTITYTDRTTPLASSPVSSLPGQKSQTSLLKELFYQGSEETESFVHQLWESKMVKMLWKIVWWFLKKICKHMLQRTESGVSKMHSSIIYKSKKVEATQVSTDS